MRGQTDRIAEGGGFSDDAWSVASRVGEQFLEKTSAKEITPRARPSNSHAAAPDPHHSSS
jgi:hypothetical protein